MTKIAGIVVKLDAVPSQAWAHAFDGFDWTAATGLDPRFDPVLDGDEIRFEGRETAKVLDAISLAIEACDRMMAAQEG
jgi:hypothetical protein